MTGLNWPGPTQLDYALVPLILPLIGAGLFAMFFLQFRGKGDFFVTLFLLGLTIGSILSVLMNTAPFTFAIFPSVMFVLWLVYGGAGNEIDRQ